LKSYDLVVIGTGTAGKQIALRCKNAGWSVAIIDSRPYGGTCQLRGCDPKKVLVAAAEGIYWGKRFNGKGINPNNTHINWPDLMTYKQTFVDGVPEGHEQRLRAAGIDLYHGQAKFIGTTAVRVGKDDYKKGGSLLS